MFIKYADIYQYIQDNIHSCLPQTIVTSSTESNIVHASQLIEAMQYSVMNGGKRIRAILVYAGALCLPIDSISSNQGSIILDNIDILHIACAVECMHAYSLIHDDLPCMDNDDMRRGKPTTHKVYGEALALLAGDALQTYAFELLSKLQHLPNIGKIIYHIASASGFMGMAGGQSIDILSETKQKILAIDALEHMHLLKTGALIDASFSMGVLACDDTKANFYNTHKTTIQQLMHALGLGFQVIDDILDSTQSSLTLGKTAGKDAQQYKCSYVNILGLEQSKKHADFLYQKALQALNNLVLPNNNTHVLYEIIELIFKRTY
jgi:farnesyl diphosphate synthase